MCIPQDPSLSVPLLIIFSYFARICPGIQPEILDTINEHQDTTSNFAATPLLLVLNAFQSLPPLCCYAFMFTQAQPRCGGNGIMVIFSAEWCKVFLLLWQRWPILMWAFTEKMLVGCKPRDLILNLTSIIRLRVVFWCPRWLKHMELDKYEIRLF